ncbi:hypothetical protein KUCAC02_004305 [Chaenocephalus aceratus]|uniref:Uncharacterized protein n=1 Tax=Chaenocephalus aceratus TaxID=36190 RepID=A0ACB9WZZ8_CHAAC|nr:hypothetical protein KUCAC02_004305 [Chaenocephalus aceratus]
MDPRIVKQILDLKVHHQIKDGELYYICRCKKNKAEHLANVVSTSGETNQLFEEFHCSNIGGHCGVEKTHCALIARYYWPGMESDIRKWIAQYPQCQAKRANIKEKQEFSPIEVTEPLELVGMDLVGKLTGSEFCNKVNSGLCERLAIKRSLCSAYHPQTNGLVEKLNGTIQRTLNKMVAGHPKRWDQVLQSTMFGLRTKKQLTTQYSPYYLMFGREARYPSEVPEEYLVKEEKVSRLVATEEIHEGLNKQEAVFTEGKHKGSLRRLDLFKHDVAVGAVCSHGHWTLIERRSLFVDPFGATDAQIEKCKDVTRALVRKKCPGTGRWECATVAHPKQQDSSSCGVFVCKKGVAMLRLDTSMSLVTNSDDLSQLCRACGELSSLAEGDIDTWIECTTCNMWYHLGCMGLPSTEDEYFCPSCTS